MAKEYNKRPSEILFIDDPYTAFCLDEACIEFFNNWNHEKNKWSTPPKWVEEKQKKNNRDFIREIKKL